MRFSHRRHVLRLTGASALLSLAALATSQPALADAAWPTRPITFIVPGAAGSTTDTPARFLAQKLGERLGQAIVVDNKPGAGGTLGSSRVARAQPDGYTVLVGNPGSNAINCSAYQKLPYKAEDFVALTDIFSSAGVGQTTHLMGELL